MTAETIVLKIIGGIWVAMFARSTHHLWQMLTGERSLDTVKNPKRRERFEAMLPLLAPVATPMNMFMVFALLASPGVFIFLVA